MMKRIIIIFFLLAIVTFAGLMFWVISIAFTKVKPTAVVISDKLAKQVISKVVRIPEGIQRPAYDFYETTYFWEMETLEKEVTGVRLKYTPSYNSEESEIIVALEMPQDGDPSLFSKVLPAVIADEKVLTAAQNPTKPELLPAPNTNYYDLELSADPKNKQTIAIKWKIKKEQLPEDLADEYKKLNYSPRILKTLYDIPSIVVDIFRS